MKRRELFNSIKSSVKKEKKTRVIRPPYFQSENSDSEELFITKCIECEGACAVACEQNIIKIAEDKTPFLDFSNSGCTYCDDCAKACPYEVLKLEHKHNIQTKISINILKCLSWNQTMCFSCKDPCFDDAITFLAMFRPEINENCTSCGFCVSVCPVDAIEIGV